MMGSGGCNSISILRPGSVSSIIVWVALCCSPIGWTGAPNKSPPAIPARQEIEQVFRGLKDGDWLGWGPRYHWTDSKIRIHAFYCMLGITLLQTIAREAQA